MADSNKPGGYEPPKVPIERNLLLAFLLVGVMMWIWQAYFTPPPPKKSATPAA